MRKSSFQVLYHITPLNDIVSTTCYMSQTERKPGYSFLPKMFNKSIFVNWRETAKKNLFESKKNCAALIQLAQG